MVDRILDAEWVDQNTGEIVPAGTPVYTDYSAEQPYPVPPEEQFGDDAFISAPDLEQIGKRLINKHDHLGGLMHLRGTLDPYDDGFTVLYRWKKEGGKSGGSRTFGKCTKTGGLLQFETGVDFVVWLAADHCRDYRLTGRQVEALVFHELMHTDVTDKGKPTTRAHDATVFLAEIREYGLWFDNLESLGMTIEQLGLFEEAE